MRPAHSTRSPHLEFYKCGIMITREGLEYQGDAKRPSVSDASSQARDRGLIFRAAQPSENATEEAQPDWILRRPKRAFPSPF